MNRPICHEQIPEYKEAGPMFTLSRWCGKVADCSFVTERGDEMQRCVEHLEAGLALAFHNPKDLLHLKITPRYETVGEASSGANVTPLPPPRGEWLEKLAHLTV